MATPPDFAPNQVVYDTDMNKIGLWRIKTVTGGNGAASVPVTDVFSDDFIDYRVAVTGGTIATAQNLRMRLGVSPSNYYAGYVLTPYNTTGGVLGGGDNGATYWTQIGYIGATTGAEANITITSPFQTRRTGFICQHGQFNTAAGLGGINGSGFHNSATSHTDFTIFTTTGNLTADITITVWGFNPA